METYKFSDTAQDGGTGPITLPATPEDFVAYQERLIRRKLTPAEQEATAEWLEIFNDISTGDMNGSAALENMDHILNQVTDEDLLHFLTAARAWIVYAWEERGR